MRTRNIRKIETIQQVDNRNAIYAGDSPSESNMNHLYVVCGTDNNQLEMPHFIEFQIGLAGEAKRTGLQDNDLLEIVKDRLTSFQSGEYASDYKADALYHVEKALEALNEPFEEKQRGRYEWKDI